MAGFVEGQIEGSVFIEGKVFPKTLSPSLPEMSVDALVDIVQEKREWLHNTLATYSAILFKGFNITSAEEFGRVIQTFGWDDMPYLAPGPRPILRHSVGGRVHTSNATPVTQIITFHHEMALTKETPSKIFFFCLKSSPEGGETAIVPSQIVVSMMEERLPQFVSQIESQGLTHRVRMEMEYKYGDNDDINDPWKWILDTPDLEESERRAKEKLLCSEVKFTKDGVAEIVFGPLNPIRTYNGKRVWYNTIVCYAPEDTDKMTLGDGTPIPQDAIDVYKRILEEHSVKIKWEDGDFMVLDNLMVQHARLPGKPPRQILVSFCK